MLIASSMLKLAISLIDDDNEVISYQETVVTGTAEIIFAQALKRLEAENKNQEPNF
jgi:hypothetical protein